MEVVFVGNEGVLVHSSTGRVMIDAIFADGAKPYALTPREVIEAAENGHDPFAGVNLLVATHAHPDHFNARSVARHLSRNPETVFLSTHQAVEMLEREAEWFDAIADRVYGVNPQEGVCQTMTLAGIAVQVFGLSHGRLNYSHVQHLGVIIELEGRRVVHLGDGIIHERTLASAGVLDGGVDVAFMPFWFLTYPFGRRLVHERFRPRHIFAIHIPPPEREEIVAAVRETAPEAVPLVNPLERHPL